MQHEFVAVPHDAVMILGDLRLEGGGVVADVGKVGGVFLVDELFCL
jgi:hypothetical protein